MRGERKLRGLRQFMLMLVCIAFFQTTYSQPGKRANIWYFGEEAGLDFTQGHPVALTNGAMKAFEGTAAICDAQGNLQFYTNGGDAPYMGGIWNRDHNLMPNGNLDGAGGCGSAFQSSLIVPHPKYEELYYLFTTDCIENNSTGGLRYSIIDMSLDGGKGDVAIKDVLLTTPVDESLTAIQHANGIDYWIITHKLNTDSFYVYHLTPQGITGLMKSKIGPVTPDYAGALKASTNGERLVYSGLNFTALFNFNNQTGLISNYVNLGVASYSCCFSPNCELLYVANGVNRKIFQFDLIQHDIVSSAIIVGTTVSTGFGGMQLGPDDRIYIARFVTSSYLGVIQNPNIKGTGCTYLDDGIYLAGKIGKGGLPNYANNMVGECVAYPVENRSNYAQFMLEMQNIGSSNFTLTWHSTERNTNYAVLFKENESGTWKEMVTADNSTILKNLNPATTYNVRVLPLDKNYTNYEVLTTHFTNDVLGKNFEESKTGNEAVVTTLDKFDFSLYPNPARKSTTVKLDAGVLASQVDIFILDMNGKTVQEFNYDEVSGSREILLPLNSLTNGIYHIAVQTEEMYKIEKLVMLK